MNKEEYIKSHVDPYWFPLGPIQQAWMAALRSGEWRPLGYKLGYANTNRRCCLGVACSIGLVPWKVSGVNIGEDSFSTNFLYTLSKWHYLLGLQEESGMFIGFEHEHILAFEDWFSAKYGQVARCSLAAINDSYESFEMICDICETWPSIVFTWPK